LKQLLRTLGHAALGGAIAYALPVGVNAIGMIPHIDPVIAATLGSIISSAISGVLPSSLRPPDFK